MCFRLSNDKPSAIFRLRGTFSAQSSLTHAAFQTGGTPGDPSGDVAAVLGISVEPLSDIQTQLSALPNALARPAPAPTASDATLLAEKVVKHLFNYLSSFAADSGSNVTPDSYVQLRAITKWYESFMSKIRVSGLAFLDRQE